MKTLIKTIRIQSGVVLCSPMVKTDRPRNATNEDLILLSEHQTYRDEMECFNLSFVKVDNPDIIWNLREAKKLSEMPDNDYPAPDNCYMTVKEERCFELKLRCKQTVRCMSQEKCLNSKSVCTVSFEPAGEEKEPDFKGMADAWFGKYYPKTSMLDLQVKGAFVAGCNAGLESKQYYENKLDARQRIIDAQHEQILSLEEKIKLYKDLIEAHTNARRFSYSPTEQDILVISDLEKQLESKK